VLTSWSFLKKPELK